MQLTGLWLTLVLGSAAADAGGRSHEDWDAYTRANRYECPGPFDTLATPRMLTLAGKKYEQTGFRVAALERDADHRVRIGVVGAIKDCAPATMANLEEALRWFANEGVEWIVANGDLAAGEFDMETILQRLGESGLPTLFIPGNSDNTSSMVRAYRDRAEAFPNLINGMWVRQIVADDAEFWSVPGYHDPAFMRQGASCRYERQHVRDMRRALRAGGDAAVIVVAHGPPLGSGPTALDWILDKKNVGDANLSRLLDKENVRIGLFGHILEAGGRGVGADRSSPVSPGATSSHLYVNTGSLSGDPWLLNDGSTSYGMATIVTLEDDRARYAVRRFPYRPPTN